jgi:hypothetical protein
LQGSTKLAGKIAMLKTNEHTVHSRAVAQIKRAQHDFRKDLDHVQAKLDLLAKTHSKILTPAGKFCQNWDVIMICGILFTATVTPFEIAFLKDEFRIDTLFIMNRVVDLLFLFDMYVNLRLSYYDNTHAMWVQDKQMIISHYLKGWFTIDALSLFPFDLMSQIMDAVKIGNTKNPLSKMKVVRLLKLLKLIKLVRILRSSRIAYRVQLALGLSFAGYNLVKFSVIVVTMLHWIACLWRLVPVMEHQEENWMTESGLAAAGGESGTHNDAASISMNYIASFQFALLSMVMSIGQYPPVTAVERSVCILCFMVSGSIYAYVIGAVCGLVSNVDPASDEFQETMDLVNKYLREHRMPHDLCMKIRNYIKHCQKMMREKYYKKVLAILSPTVQGEIAVIKHNAWIKQIPFFCSPIEEEQQAFTAAIATKLGAEAFAPNEGIYMEGAMATTLFVVERGIASLECAIMSHNKAFGLEMIMHAGVRQHQAVALTYLDCITLSNDDLYEVMELGGWAFVTIKRLIRQEAIRLSMRQAMREICQASRLLHGFAIDQRLLSDEEVRQTRMKYHDKAEQKHVIHHRQHEEHEHSSHELRIKADLDLQVRAKREAALMLHFWGSDDLSDAMEEKSESKLHLGLSHSQAAEVKANSVAKAKASQDSHSRSTTPAEPEPYQDSVTKMQGPPLKWLVQTPVAPSGIVADTQSGIVADTQSGIVADTQDIGSAAGAAAHRGVSSTVSTEDILKVITDGFNGLNARVDKLEQEFEKVHAAKPKSGNHDVLRAHLTRLRTSHLTQEDHQNKLHDHFNAMKH